MKIIKFIVFIIFIFITFEQIFGKGKMTNKEPEIPLPCTGQNIANAKNLFIHENPEIPEMVQLREKYKLQEIISREKNEFARIIALRSWVQQAWKRHGHDQIPEKNNALKILEAARQGKNFQCWHYATVFVQCAVSLGFKARRLNIGIHPAVKRPGNTGHIVAEIWSSEFNKWIVMDADMNAHYAQNGIPLNALEIHQAWISQQLGDIKYIQGNPVPAMIAEKTPAQLASKFVFGAYNVMDYYFKIQIEMRNNWFSSRKEAKPIAAIAWIDKYHPEYSKNVGRVIGNVLWTDNPKLLYWKEK